ncbi:FAD-dependent oxidoreductase [Paenibacillus naphthalenovorans]|uniref:FAD dependent oxidoreductase n=1 Tax=Paenibacillus naphthalenovorans TaxID=162209 RepID=A0A0U2W4V9_9BACL|nr:FAD-dependent oxidoreductase [Paenibacillus naphthalenovorans]ALS23572.1 FAD dependent oxidoreductase [Paenibacillus naphthalenovorans]
MEEMNLKVTRTVQKDITVNVQEVKVDICVVGAGISGVSAALEAARSGHKVALVDGSPTLGGQAVNSIIGTFAGLVSNGPNPYLMTYGIAEDIIRDLGAAGNLHLRRRFNTIMYDEVALARWIEKSVRDAGVTVITGAVLRGVTRKGTRIDSIDLATRYGDLRLYANGFVDATGDAALAWHAGLPCREPAEGSVYGSQVLVLEGIDEKNYPSYDELIQRLKDKADDYGFERRDGLAIVFPGRGTALLNMTHVETPLEPIAAAEKALEGKDQADRTVVFLKNEFPLAFGQCRVRSYGFPGVRQTRWIVGRRQLTVEDVRAGTRFPDAVARTAWPIELHNRKDGYVWQPFSEDHVHYIPLSSLTPPDVDNLAAAGRCIDGDLAALSSVRVMGPCIATGAAAAHALSLAGTGSVHEIDIAALQERLKDNLTRMDPYNG